MRLARSGNMELVENNVFLLGDMVLLLTLNNIYLMSSHLHLVLFPGGVSIHSRMNLQLVLNCYHDSGPQ